MAQGRMEGGGSGGGGANALPERSAQQEPP